MTISSSMNAGVAGLSANASRLAAISDNIANSATQGYKRSVTEFHSMVVNGERVARYTAGGVTTSSLRLIDESGPLVRTDNATDLSIDGRGFIPVSPMESLADDGRPTELSLVTTGSFRADNAGYLRTPSGLVLLGWPAAPDGTIPLFSRETITGLQPVRINTSQISANPTTAASIAANLPATETRAGSAGTPHEMSMEYFNTLGDRETLTFTFTPTVPGAGASNTWTMEIADSASGAVVGEYTLVFDTAVGTGGTLASVTAVTGGAYDPVTGRMDLTLPHGVVSLSIGTPGTPGGMSQLSTGFVPTAPTKNGSPASTLIGVDIDSQGNLYGIFDAGFSRLLYQIPVADVRNPNGLIAVGDQAYKVSNASGDFYLWTAGSGPSGKMSAYTREESSTDVARELTQLIQTQRAYSSNAKVIQTVDEMLQETTNLKR